MTNQIPDELWHENESYVILQGPAKLGFDPIDYAMWPIGLSTANHRGYWCDYAVADGGMLTLEKLSINSRAGYYPPINGVKPSAPRLVKAKMERWNGKGFETVVEDVLSNRGYHFYDNLRLALRYSGRIMLGRTREAWLCTGYLFPPVWAFREVFELAFEDGLLVDAADISWQFTEERARRIERKLERFSDG